jgi:hypothetical protein
VFYLAVGLVCSYHCNNTRTSLVVGYVSLALYGLISFLFWQMLAQAQLALFYTGTTDAAYSTYSSNGLTHLSRNLFEISPVDLLHTLPSRVIFVALFAYLYARISNRRADRPATA